MHPRAHAHTGTCQTSQEVLTAGLATLTAMRVLRTALARSRTRVALTQQRDRSVLSRAAWMERLTRPELPTHSSSSITALQPHSEGQQAAGQASTHSTPTCDRSSAVASLHAAHQDGYLRSVPMGTARALCGCPAQGYVAAQLIFITVSISRLELLKSLRKSVRLRRLQHQQRQEQWRRERQQLHESAEALAALLEGHGGRQRHNIGDHGSLGPAV